MENIWKWRRLTFNEKINIVTFIVEEVVEKMPFYTMVKIMQLMCFVRFLQQQNLIASVFDKALLLFDQQMQFKTKHVRLELKDNTEIEIVARLYDFLPNEVKVFVDQLRIKHQSIAPNEENIIHLLRCNYFKPNRNHLEFFLSLTNIKQQNIDILLENYIFDPLSCDFFSDQEYVFAYLLNKKQAKKLSNQWTDFFEYDIFHVPAIPNELFLNQLCNSIDKICHQKKFITLLLNHLYNLMEDDLLFLDTKVHISIICKMILYNITNDQSNLRLFLQKQNTSKYNEDIYVHFLLSKALNQECDYRDLKSKIAQLNENQQESILNILFPQ